MLSFVKSGLSTLTIILELVLAKGATMLNHYRDPQTFSLDNLNFARIGSERKYGVELEYEHVPDHYKSPDSLLFGSKDDCSVEDGGEFDSPILAGDEGLTACEEFCDHAYESGFETGREAGYHLHMDMTNESFNGLKRIALGYLYTQDVWQSVVPQDRRLGNGATGPLCWDRRALTLVSGYEDFRTFMVRRAPRDSWLNIRAWDSHKTFEIRNHESTLCGKDVTTWIMAHLRFVDAMSESTTGSITRTLGRKNRKELIRELRAIIQSDPVMVHLDKRYYKYN